MVDAQKKEVNTEYYPNGTVKSIGEWADNDFSGRIRIGEHKYFHRNGQLELIERFKKNGRRIGSVKGFYKNGNPNAFKNLVEYTLRFFIRARTICVEEPTKLEQFASRICDMIRSGKTISDIKIEFRNEQNSEALVLAKFKEKTKSTIRRDFFILEKINQWAYGQINSDLTTLAHSRKSVEHIMPENLTDEWINDLQKDPTAPTNIAQIKELHKANLHKWGNLTPMNKWANSALQDELFSVKNNHPEGYKASNAEINQKIEF